MMKRLKWPAEHLTTLLQYVLVGKSLEVCNQLDVFESANYEFVKEVIFQAYQRVPEAYHQRSGITPNNQIRRTCNFPPVEHEYFDHWCHSVYVKQDFDNLQ